MLQHLLRAAQAMILGLCAAAAAAQPAAYPAKPVTIVANAPPGGPNDIVARLLASRLSEGMGQPFVVENRAGAGGNIGSAVVAKAPADGYRLLVTAGNAITANPLLYRQMPFDPAKDLAPVAVVGESALVLVVSPQLGVRTLAEFAAAARRQPLRYSSGGNGSPAHLTFEYLLRTLGVSAQHIPYNGSAPAAMALLSGEVHAGFLGALQGVQLVRSGKAVALAVSSPQRLASLPEVPTVAEAGEPGFAVTMPMVLMAPAGTDPAIVAALYAQLAQAFKEPGVRAAYERMEMAPALLDPAATQLRLAAERARWSKVVESSGIRID